MFGVSLKLFCAESEAFDSAQNNSKIYFYSCVLFWAQRMEVVSLSNGIVGTLLAVCLRTKQANTSFCFDTVGS